MTMMRRWDTENRESMSRTNERRREEEEDGRVLDKQLCGFGAPLDREERTGGGDDLQEIDCGLLFFFFCYSSSSNSMNIMD